MAAVLLVFGGMIVRGGMSPEQVGAPWGGDERWQTEKQLGIFERELVVDAGATLGNIGNLLIISSVIASLAIGFPGSWVLSLVFFVSSLLPAAWMVWWSLRQMRIKRSRQQNVFDSLAPTDSTAAIFATGRGGVPIRSARDYWADRNPSFLTWQRLNRVGRSIALLRQIIPTAKLYFPLERSRE